MKKHIPNSLTLLNLFSGCLGIIHCLNGQYKEVPLFIFVSLVADFLDGFVARLLKVKSDLGAQLDSLADMVTFGVLPAMMMMQLAFSVYHYNSSILPYCCLVSALFACLRLAKFNIDTRQTVDFIGLNTPATTIFVLGYYLFYFQYRDSVSSEINFESRLYSLPVILSISVILSYLMIAELRIFSMKGKFNWTEAKWKIIFLIIAIPLLIASYFYPIFLSLIIVLYIIFSILHNTFQKKVAAD